MASKDGRAAARDNELRVLRALHRFGWLRTRDIAALVWLIWAKADGAAVAPSLRPAVPTAAGLRMAQRTLGRLYDRRWTLRARAPDGATIYALAEAGARFLQQSGIAAESGKDLLRPQSGGYYRHRCIANAVAIGAIVDGLRASTEREIAQGRWFGGTEGVAGKRPDVLIRDSTTAWWVEVERSRKNAREYGQLLCWLDAALTDARLGAQARLLNSLRWGKIAFICTPAFEMKLRADLSDRGWPRQDLDQWIEFSTSLYKLEDIVFF